MSPSEVEEYILVMKRHGVQGLQIESNGTKLIISGVYADIQPMVNDMPMPDDGEPAIDKLMDD